MVKPYSNKKEYIQPVCRSLNVDCGVVMTSPEPSKCMSLGSATDDDDDRCAGSYRNSLWND